METLCFLIVYFALFISPFFFFESEKVEERLARRAASKQSTASFGGLLLLIFLLMHAALVPFIHAVELLKMGDVVRASGWAALSLLIIQGCGYLLHSKGVTKSYPRPWVQRLLRLKPRIVV